VGNSHADFFLLQVPVIFFVAHLLSLIFFPLYFHLFLWNLVPSLHADLMTPTVCLLCFEMLAAREEALECGEFAARG
jgi:hypothetical protein